MLQENQQPLKSRILHELERSSIIGMNAWSDWSKIFESGIQNDRKILNSKKDENWQGFINEVFDFKRVRVKIQILVLK